MDLSRIDAAPEEPRGSRVMLPIVVVVTCGRCGQSWHQGASAAGETECVVCGYRGLLRLGPVQECHGARHVEGRLECLVATD